MSKDGQTIRARQDLARQLHVDEADITVKRVKDTQWPDASLGLGKPGSSYAMVMIDGYIIELDVAGKTYVYHADEDRNVVRAS
jgi:hypothetical protein